MSARYFPLWVLVSATAWPWQKLRIYTYICICIYKSYMYIHIHIHTRIYIYRYMSGLTREGVRVLCISCGGQRESSPCARSIAPGSGDRDVRLNPACVLVCSLYMNGLTRRAPARLRQPEPRMRLAVRGVAEGALCTHSA